MGMTLPVMTRIVVEGRAIGTPIARLYGLNTLGAAMGALLSAYVLVGTLGLEGTVHVAAATNVALAAWVSFLAAHPTAPAAPLAARPAAGAALPGGSASPALVAALAAASGLVALGCEIVWYRVLGVVLHGTVYVFGTVLTVYLLGIAVGSLAARRTWTSPARCGASRGRSC